MMKMMKKNVRTPDETREFDNGKVQIVHLEKVAIGTVTFEKVTFGLVTLQPGWKWSKDVKKLSQTKSCKAPHVAYHISGRLCVRMDDGKEMEFGPGDVAIIPSGHDAWVVGNEPVVTMDINGMVNYAKKA
jgi:quercetin dioxygenase-like cupin family protein